MSVTLPEEVRQVIDDRTFAHLATLDGTGGPHVTAMWITRDADLIVFNTLEGRAKWRHMQRDPRVAISLSPPGDDYLNFLIKGRVIEMRTSDGTEVINSLAHKYIGRDYPRLGPGDVRVTVIVEPISITRNP